MHIHNINTAHLAFHNGIERSSFEAPFYRKKSAKAEKLQLPLFNELQEVAAGTRQENRPRG